MSTGYKRDDLTAQVRATGASLDPAVWIVDPDLSSVEDVPAKHWKLDGDAVVEMDQGEKDAVDAAELAKAISERVQACGGSFTSMLYAHYNQEAQQSLSTYLSEARYGGLVNRASYILQALGWIDFGLTAYYGKKDEIEAAASLEELNAVLIDWSGLESFDPAVTLRQARTILD